MQMPLGAAQIVFLVISASVATYVRSTRILMMITTTSASMVGMILIWKLDAGNQAGQLTGLTLGAVFAVNIPMSLSLISSNVAGFTKRSVINSLVFIAYCLGNIVGPQFFYASEEPNYPVSFCLENIQVHILVLTNMIDRNQSGHVWTDFGYFLFDLFTRVLYLGESSTG